MKKLNVHVVMVQVLLKLNKLKMIEFEEIYNESERIYEKDYSTGEYCHEQSFKWGFQEGVKFAEKILTECHTPNGFKSDKNILHKK